MAMTAEEVVWGYAVGRRDFRRAYLAGAVLRRASLGGANLSGADLSGADLAGADLSGADLKRVCLAEADLTGANLADADLRGSDLRLVDLVGANLCHANLDGANLLGPTWASLDPGLSLGWETTGPRGWENHAGPVVEVEPSEGHPTSSRWAEPRRPAVAVRPSCGTGSAGSGRAGCNGD
jgi:uncharacterized protein YjbI with pentapeptide repeats